MEKTPPPQSAPLPKQPVAAAPRPAYKTPAPTSGQDSVGSVVKSKAAVIGTFVDSRDGTTYKTVVIDGKKWMAKNLNYQPQTGKSWCYGNNDANCAKYGRLYDWNTAKTVCPSGWHLPFHDEWGALAKAVGGTGVFGTAGMAGKKLKTKSGWNNGGNGTDEYGFSALPGGGRSADGGFNNIGYYGYWWTATDSENRYAYYRDIHYYSGNVGASNDVKSDGFSVRCIAD